ncbi:hypothetical protein D3W54_07475 [Komagataeibacter medellinensis]|uniref:Uncharacterized protein n=2 Tax=Komagataeibacter medellinensis TaxID=1177712 RepID=G2I090_KOMMN|nr:hypothetical protein [Komagataeibacter medellinensis]KAB8124067.1 hypothetical protein D3W54_07475 [Komagataeibacter medellinensis]BAK84348.1 hypothetical protein GLX_19360 [Komagataeibacter medellinensis NBRC 3288]
MSAFSRLWQRAPLWRLCLYLILPFGLLTFIFPPAYLTRLLPKLAAISASIHNHLGMHNAPAEGVDSTGGNNDGDGVITMMPITDRLTKAIPFAGRILPLPAGVWHPVMNIINGPHGEVLENVLVRVQGHVVTGLIGAEGSTQPVPETAIASIDSSCHDDRNFMSHVLSAHPPAMECWFTAAVYPASINRTAIIANRLKEEGFILPPVFLKSGWSYSTPAGDHNVNVETVTIFINPVNTDSTKMLRTPEFWNKDTLGQQPAAADFVKRTNTWMAGWAQVLHDGFNSDMLASSEEQRARLSRDPAATPAGQGNPLD